MGIGGRLKETREQLNMSLDTLQEITKIQKRYLIAIENGDFHVLPGTFYARAFIKEYAIAIDLDPEQLLHEFRDDIPSPETDQTSVPYSRLQRTRKRNEPKNTAVFSFIPTVIVVLLIVGVLFVAWSLYQKSADSGDKTDPEERTDSLIRNPNEKQEPEKDEGDIPITDVEEEEEEEIIEHAFETTEVGSGSRPESTFVFTSGTPEVEVQIATEDETWLSVRDDIGDIEIDQMLQQAGSPLELDISEVGQLYISLGNASNVTITINGEIMEFPVDPKKYVVQKLWINIEKTE